MPSAIINTLDEKEVVKIVKRELKRFKREFIEEIEEMFFPNEPKKVWEGV